MSFIVSTANLGPALTRLSNLSALGARSMRALERALEAPHTGAAREELQSDGAPIPCHLLILDGWAARVRDHPDGRRQFLSFLLPGDFIGLCHQPHPLAVSSIIALTDVTFCRAPDASDLPDLEEAYGMSSALEEAYLLEHITRLGGMSAANRLRDLLLEFRERLALAGLADAHEFAMPLTQEAIADALGMTAIHTNRMIQQARRCGDIQWKDGHIRLHDPEALADHIGRRAAMVAGG